MRGLSNPVSLLLIVLGAPVMLANDCSSPPTYYVRNLREVPTVRPCSIGLDWDEPSPPPPAGIFKHRITRGGFVAKLTGAERTVSTFVRPLYETLWLLPGSSYWYNVRVEDRNHTLYPGTGRRLTTQACSQLTPQPEIRTQIVLMQFSDGPQMDPSSVADSLVFGADQSVGAYWDEVSYGRQTLLRSMHQPSQQPRRVLSSTLLSSVCTTRTADGFWEGEDCVRQPWVDEIASIGDWSLADRFILVVYGVKWRGSSAYLDSAAGRTWGILIGGRDGLVQTDVNTMVHELGHLTAGVDNASHAARLRNCGGGFPANLLELEGTGCAIQSYGEDWDPMGWGYAFDDPAAGRSLQHFNAYNKELLGFLDESRIAVVRDLTPEGVVLPLWPIEFEDVGAPPIEPYQMIKIMTNDPAHFFLEYRWNDEIEGVIVRVTDATRGSSATGPTTYVSDPPVVLRYRGDVFESPAHNLRIEVSAEELFRVFDYFIPGAVLTIGSLE